MKKRLKMLLALAMVLVMLMPMSALAWSETKLEANNGAQMSISLNTKTTIYNGITYGSYEAKQNLYKSSLTMEKFVTTINTHCTNVSNNRTYTKTCTNKNSCAVNTKLVVDGYDDTGIEKFGLRFEHQSAGYGNSYFGRTVHISQV